MTESINQSSTPWEQKALEKILLESVKEQRRGRRWGILFKSLFILYLLILLILFLQPRFNATASEKSHTALIDIKGIIAEEAPAEADKVTGSLRAAFDNPHTQGIILRINSPGGSPVQASYVYNEIKRLKQLHPTTKVYAVCTDICASAAYYIASAADEIYADPASLVGSIGTVLSSFGFVDTMKKLGIERRLLVSGKNKGILDPFLPLEPAEVKHVQTALDIVHRQFINHVKEGRGPRLKNNPEIFSGLFWSGETAKQLGLVDGFGSTGFVARTLVKNENIIDYTLKPNYFNRLAKRLGASMGQEIRGSLEKMEVR